VCFWFLPEAILMSMKEDDPAERQKLAMAKRNDDTHATSVESLIRKPLPNAQGSTGLSWEDLSLALLASLSFLFLLLLVSA
jgi:hypothetical protein